MHSAKQYACLMTAVCMPALVKKTVQNEDLKFLNSNPFTFGIAGPVRMGASVQRIPVSASMFVI